MEPLWKKNGWNHRLEKFFSLNLPMFGRVSHSAMANSSFLLSFL
jgi:hypothetical protein